MSRASREKSVVFCSLTMIGPHQNLQANLPSFMSNTNAGLDSSQVAKQMAALTAANQARISQNTRSTLPTPGGINSGPYPGAINSHTYPQGGHDLVSNTNPHPNFQVPNNTYGLPPTSNPVGNASFPDPAISQANQSRNQVSGSSSLKQRQQGFLQGLAGLMAKRNTPLPPSLTGIPYSNYDPSNTLWSIIEPSSEVGSFRLAGRDVDLFKLWGLVFQQGGGHLVNANNAWGSILPHFDLPDEFPQMQANNSTSVALMLSQYYMAILFPFEEVYRKNLQDQRGKASMVARQGMPAQQFPASTPGVARPSLGMSNTQQIGMHPMSSNNLIPQGLPGGSIPSNGLAQYPSVHNPPTQHHPSSASLPIGSVDAHTTMPSELDSLMHAVDSNLLDPDIQGIKRKLDQDERDIKRARQKTDPPEGSSTTTGAPDLSSTPQTRSNSQAPPSLAPSGPSRPQASRRKIEYVPLAREVDTYGGRDLKVIDAEWAAIPLRRLRDINEWGTVDIETLAMSLRSRLAIEMTYALTTVTVLSTMRGQTPGSGFPIYQCGDLFDELLDLMEDLAFGKPEESPESVATDSSLDIVTNRKLVSLVHEAEIRPFAPLEPRQGSKAFNLGPPQRPGILIMAVVNIVRNLSIIPDNGEFLSGHPRLIDVMLRLCTLKVDDSHGPLPASEHLSLSDLLTIRKDTLYTLSSISGLINLSRHASFHRLGSRIFDLVATYLVDPTDAISPLASVQAAGIVPNANLKPPALADVALEVFTRFSQADGNRQVIAKVVPPSSLWLLLTRLVHRLPIVDADFVLMQREYWLSFVEKTVMAIYSLVFLAPPDLKQKIKTDRTLAFKNVILRMVHKAVMMPSHDGRSMTIVSAKRAIEAMKVLDGTEDVFEQSEATMPILSFGMGFSDSADTGPEKGTGILGGKGDVAWEMMMLRDVFQDERMFNELDSLVRIEC